MNKRTNLFIVLFSAILITILFHKQSLGVNLFVYETLIIAWMLVAKQITIMTNTLLAVWIGLILTSVFSVLVYTVFVYIMNITALFVFTGILIYPEIKSLLNTVGISFSTLFYSQLQFLKELSNSKIKGRHVSGYLWKSRIFIIPVLIILLFIILYRKSNPLFDKIFVKANLFFKDHVVALFKDFDFSLIVTFIIGIVISNFLILRITNSSIIKRDNSSTNELKRLRNYRRRDFNLISLRNEYKAGVFLILILNLFILILNITDIYWVWFNFNWEGQYLKQYVHAGTYFLIISILISIIIILFYFRRNLNFYPKNKIFKYLSYIWLAQNGILAISVAIRNFRYINYFSLAYKRIGVFIFLILTVYGLYTVFIKVKNKKSAFYLFSTNIKTIFILLVISSLFNWDSIIASYNFKHADRSFLHLDYLTTLSDKALPYLDKSLEELILIDKFQKEKFPFEEKYMSPQEYVRNIEERKIRFKKKWESKTMLSWNLPEYIAYKKLFL